MPRKSLITLDMSESGQVNKEEEDELVLLFDGESVEDHIDSQEIDETEMSHEEKETLKDELEKFSKENHQEDEMIDQEEGEEDDKEEEMIDHQEDQEEDQEEEMIDQEDDKEDDKEEEMIDHQEDHQEEMIDKEDIFQSTDELNEFHPSHENSFSEEEEFVDVDEHDLLVSKLLEEKQKQLQSMRSTPSSSDSFQIETPHHHHKRINPRRVIEEEDD